MARFIYSVSKENVKSIFYKKRPKIWVEAKKLPELPPVSALFQRGNFCKFLPPPNFYVFSYKKWTLVYFGLQLVSLGPFELEWVSIN